MSVIQTDVAIIGAGTAGMVAYSSVRRAGRRALLIEAEQYGTTCARVGCMPSKLLIAAADVAHHAQTAAAFGVHCDAVRIDGAQLMQRVRRERDRFVDFVLQDIAAMDAQDKILGRAQFLSDTRLLVKGSEQVEVEASAVIIATGSSPIVGAEFAHLAERVLVNDDVFEWETLPERVLVVGAGIIGMELGQALSRLGVQTTLISRSSNLGGLRDPAVLASATAAFQSELDIRLNTQLGAIQRDGNALTVEILAARQAGSKTGTLAPERTTETVDYLLLATGRRPNLDNLGLENTSVSFNEKGHPHINSHTLQLGEAPIFIAGDVTAMHPVLHEAADDGYIAGRNAAHFPKVEPGQRRAPMAVVFSDPQLAYVGQRYTELPTSGVVIGEVDFANQGRARIMLKNYGKLRLYVQAQSGRFLGAEMAGPHMEHIAHLLAWCLQQELTVQQMLSMPFYHPVLEEGLRTALRDARHQLPDSVR